jgi:replicative DNA helicase
MFIYRDAYYKMKEAVDSEQQEQQTMERDHELVEEAELIIAKQRNGPTGRVIVNFMPKFARFEDRADRYDAPPPEQE